METPPATMMALFIGVIFIAVALVFAAGLSGKFPGLSDWLDKLLGRLDNTETADISAAKNSVSGLVCAVNSVLANDRDLCASKYSGSASGSLIEVIGRLTLGPRPTATTVECTGGGFPEDKECCFFASQNIRTVMNKGTCVQAGGKIEDPSVPIIVGSDFKDECTKYPAEVTCRVKNFHLPENFLGLTKIPKEYIAGFGDPTFLVYFQKFPQGEKEAWESKESWFAGVSTVMFATMCAGRFLGPVIKAGKWVLQKISPGTVLKLGEATAKIGNRIESVHAKLKEILVKYGKMSDDAAETILEKEAIVTGATSKNTLISTFKTYFGSGLKKSINSAVVRKYGNFDDYYKSTQELGLLGERGSIYYKSAEKAFADVAAGKEIVTDLTKFLPKETGLAIAKEYSVVKGIEKMVVPVAAKTGVYLGVDTASALILYGFDRTLRQTIDSPHDMILDMPKGDDEFELQFGYKEVPIILDKDKYPSFYLASPCHTDLEIRKEQIYCKRYVLDSSGSIECERASEKDTCNHYYEGIDFLPGWMTGKDCDEILLWAPKCGEDDYRGYDRKMFADNDGDGVWDEIIIYQYFRENDINAYKIVLNDTNLEDSDKRINHWQAFDEAGNVIQEGDFSLPKDSTQDFKFSITDLTAVPVEVRDEDDDGLPETIFVGNPPSDLGSTQSVITDIDGNGLWETMGVLNTEGKYEPKVALSATSKEGDVYYSEWCKTGAVIIEVDEDSMESYKTEYNEEYNFCYWKGDKVISTTLVVGSFAADAFVKKLGVGGWLLGTAADCGMAYFSAKMQGGMWPERSVF